MDRREILKHLAAFPLAGGMITADSWISASSPSDNPIIGTSGDTIYNAIGVDTIINCRGTFTIIGGSIERPEVLEAMDAASGHFVQYDELAFGVGKRLAALTQSEWGMISAGCAAGLKHVTAACVTGGDPEKLIRIPNLNGLEKTEVIIPRYSRNVYDHAIRNVGVRVIDVETADEMKKAISNRTAMIYVNLGKRSDAGQPLSLEVITEIAKPHSIPILADAAAENLTIPPVHLKRGATVVAYSGGKAICGPQCAGLLLGSKDLLMAAWQASSPHHGPGRDNKVGKEEMMGMVAAVEAWTNRDHDAEWNQWLDWLDIIAKRVKKIPGITTEIKNPTGLSNHAPTLHILWDPATLHITGYEVAEELGRNKPRVAIGDQTRDNHTSVNITPNQMQAGEAGIVAERLYGVLSQKRTQKKNKMTPPVENISGRWDMDIDFFYSQSQHILFIEQKDNWIQGFHKTEFEMLEMVGMIEGKDVKLRSNFRVPGNGITYLFSGKINQDSMTGSIYMGEYLTAEFTARRKESKHPRKPILIPGGPPLAT